MNPEWREFMRRLGKRLRELREQAGLTQGELALRLGNVGRGGKAYVCRIERGDYPGLGLHVLGGFLHACGRKTEGIADLLAEYLARPPAAEAQTRKQVADVAVGLPARKRSRVQHYDLRNRSKTGMRETPEEQRERRVRDARGQARAIRWDERLHRVHNDVLNELHVAWGDPLAIHLGAFGRKVFGALRRTRRTRPIWREKALAKLDTWAQEHGLRPEPFTRMKQAVLALFADMERSGELD